MEDSNKLEKDIVAIFQEKGDAALSDVREYLKMVKSYDKRKQIKSIISRLNHDKDGNYYVRP